VVLQGRFQLRQKPRVKWLRRLHLLCERLLWVVVPEPWLIPTVRELL
jgi:type II secretory pathway component PulL